MPIQLTWPKVFKNYPLVLWITVLLLQQQTLDEAQAILKKYDGKKPFKLSNLAVMDFPRIPQDVAASPLIDKTNANGTITKVETYKYL